MNHDLRLRSDGGLPCPVCGDEYMHHGTVRVYERVREDEPGTITEINQSVKMTAAPSKALPGRRGTVEIDFTCENGHKSTLQIMQHKGNTLVKWIEA